MIEIIELISTLWNLFRSMPKSINDIPPIDRLPVVGY